MDSQTTKARAEFQHCLEEFKRTQTGFSDLYNLQNQMEDEILDLHLKRFPQRKAARNKIPPKEDRYGRWSAVQKLAKRSFPEEFERIFQRYKAQVDGVVDENLRKRKELEEKLNVLAKDLLPEQGTEWTLLKTVSTLEYGSQTAPEHYAEGKALQHSNMFQLLGIDSEVRKKKENSTVVYEVWAKCSKLDYEIAKRRPSLSLKEQLQWYWNHGLNPRVYNPCLPHGLEEKLGVSYLPEKRRM